MAELLSVGIDIGTSTMSLVVSRLTIRNMASSFAVPRVEISEVEIVYRSEIHETPLLDEKTIDIKSVAAILEKEYEKAGVTPDQIQTGAVIITGESARKENAAAVTEYMSALAGKFVVAAAGPDMESIIAAKGAGIPKISEDLGQTVVNLDIGGGTTNIAFFRTGRLMQVGCWDIGGRLCRIDGGIITKISPSVAAIASHLGLGLAPGGRAEISVLQRVTDCMAELLGEALMLRPRGELCKTLVTREASFPAELFVPDRLSYTGGIGELIFHPAEDRFSYGDIGPLLAESIRNDPVLSAIPSIEPCEMIRATVIGAGAYSTRVSGSTVYFSSWDMFPQKNLPVFVPSEEAEKELSSGTCRRMALESARFQKETAQPEIAVALNRIKRIRYRDVQLLAEALAEYLQSLGKMVILMKADYSKVLGQAIQRRAPDQKLICLDGIDVGTGDYIDLGEPLMDGLSVPVVVKTLIFG